MTVVRAELVSLMTLYDTRYNQTSSNIFYRWRDYRHAIPDARLYERNDAFADIHIALDGVRNIDNYLMRNSEWDSITGRAQDYYMYSACIRQSEYVVSLLYAGPLELEPAVRDLRTLAGLTRQIDPMYILAVVLTLIVMVSTLLFFIFLPQLVVLLGPIVEVCAGLLATAIGLVFLLFLEHPSPQGDRELADALNRLADVLSAVEVPVAAEFELLNPIVTDVCVAGTVVPVEGRDVNTTPLAVVVEEMPVLARLIVDDNEPSFRRHP